MAEPLTATPTASAAASANMPEIVTNIITVGNFLPIPMDGFLRDRSYSHPDVRITAHHWFEGRLLLDFEFGAVTYTYDEKGNWLQSRGAVLPAIAILDPATEQWVVVSCPEADTMSRSIFYHRSVLWHGEIFNSDGNQIRKYDSLNHRWQTLKNSDGNNYELFVVNNHLYAANGTTIFEIADDGRATRILASARRNPPVSALDKLDNLGTPVLFAGTNQLLHAHVTNAVYLWQQDDWHKEADVGSSVGAELFEDGVLFRGSWSGKNEYTVPYGGFPQDDAVSLFQFAPQATSPELCLWQQYHYMNDGHTYLPIPDAIPSSRPLWKMPSGCYFTELAAALGQSNLYLLADHFNAEGQSVAAPYNAELFCFSSGLPLPQELFLKFDAPDGCPPLTKINPHSPDTWPKTPPAWILPTTNFLFIGLDKPAPPFINQNIGFGCKPGVWLLPVSKIGPAIAAQKQIQLDQMARERAVAEQLQKDLLTKYDRNHNGVIDPDEKEEALDDPAFIELELDEIDANHNGWLDAEELAWFDANTNKILELKEQAGIEIAQHLLAERLLKKFDANGDGLLNRQEFNNLLQSNMETYIRSMPGVSSMPFPFPDENHDGYVDLGELETFLKQQTSQGLRPRGMPGRTFFLQTRTDPNKPVDARQLFKAAVESYWQNPGGVTNQPPFNGRVPPGARFVPNGIPQGAAQ
jgi:Ca2+-binding EF-hand superfamily protein